MTFNQIMCWIEWSKITTNKNIIQSSSNIWSSRYTARMCHKESLVVAPKAPYLLNAYGFPASLPSINIFLAPCPSDSSTTSAHFWIFDHPKSWCFLQLMRNLSEHTIFNPISNLIMSPCFFWVVFVQKESSTYPPFFRQLKNQPNTNNAHFLEDLQKSTHPSHFSGKKKKAEQT